MDLGVATIVAAIITAYGLVLAELIKELYKKGQTAAAMGLIVAGLLVLTLVVVLGLPRVIQAPSPSTLTPSSVTATLPPTLGITKTSVPPMVTNTPLPPTETSVPPQPTETPVPPPTETPVPPPPTDTPVPPTNRNPRAPNTYTWHATKH